MYKGEMRLQSNNDLFECSLSTLEVALNADMIGYFKIWYFKINGELQSCSFFKERGRDYIRFYGTDRMILDDGTACDIIRYFDFEIIDVILSKKESHTLTLELGDGVPIANADMTFDADIPRMTKEEFDKYATRILKEHGFHLDGEPIPNRRASE